jgi:Trk-type K+ transport system membrane component
MQWVGGLGIVVLFIAAMIQPGLAAKRLDITEDFEDDLIGSTRGNARRVSAIYAILIVFLKTHPARRFQLWTHTMSLSLVPEPAVKQPHLI